jgi:hypothetical protein
MKKKEAFDYVLKKVSYALEDNDIPYYLDCGTLLGCIRDGDFMDHDTDVDVATHTSFWEKLINLDFKKYDLNVTRKEDITSCGGFLMSVEPVTGGGGQYCDIYANPSMPLLTKAKLNDKDYPIPKDSELYLRHLYGKDWKIPKWAEGDIYHADWPPLFYKEERLITSDYSKNWDSKYEITLWENDSMYITNLRKRFDMSYVASNKWDYRENNDDDKEYWKKYYETNYEYLDKPSSFAKYVWLKYIKNKKLKIADLGCGNCRDSKFFSTKGNICYAIDNYGTLNKKQPKCKLIKKDVEEALFFQKGFKTSKFDVMYMRWFLHAMPYVKSKRIFKSSVNNTKKGGLICIEVRSLNDSKLINDSVYNDIDKSYTTTHKRWPYDVEMLEKLAKENGCEIIECEEGYFSPNKKAETHDPLLIRVILKKN